MWWLPVLGWTFLFIAVICYAWLSLARDRYYARAENAKLLRNKLPEEPWYVKYSWQNFFEDRR